MCTQVHPEPAQLGGSQANTRWGVNRLGETRFRVKLELHVRRLLLFWLPSQGKDGGTGLPHLRGQT